MDFKNKVVVITGASSGIGKATAEKFAKKGSNIVMVGRREEKILQLEKTLSKYKISTLVCKCNVSEKSQVKEMSDIVLERFGKIDILVNNAGFGIYGTVLELSIEEIEAQMITNYFGTVYCIKNFLPSMLGQNSGHIVNVASLGASFGLPGMASYCASKFAMLGFSEALHHELKDTGVGVTVVSPIMVKTNFFDHPSFDTMPKNFKRALSPETVAEAIIKASDSSKLELVIPPIARGAVWAKHTLPFLINPILGSAFKKRVDTTKN